MTMAFVFLKMHLVWPLHYCGFTCDALMIRLGMAKSMVGFCCDVFIDERGAV